MTDGHEIGEYYLVAGGCAMEGEKLRCAVATCRGDTAQKLRQCFHTAEVIFLRRSYDNEACRESIPNRQLPIRQS